MKLNVFYIFYTVYGFHFIFISRKFSVDNSFQKLIPGFNNLNIIRKVGVSIYSSELSLYTHFCYLP